MTFLNLIKSAVIQLDKLDCSYCLIGGHAASLYRAKERFTNDVDFALVARNIGDSRAIAEDFFRKMGLKHLPGCLPLAKGELPRGSICMVCSEVLNSDAIKGSIDIILPELPWVEKAVLRAQNNKANLGFANVPIITVEDLIISKSYSYRNSQERFQDLDDLKYLLEVESLDLNYLLAELDNLSLAIPKQLKKKF